MFSTLGVGESVPISVEEAMLKLGIIKEDKPFNDIDYGNFTGNGTLVNWWKLLCKLYK